MNPALNDKEKWLRRPDDIPLPRIWEQMRLRQRELSWSQYLMNAQMANCSGQGLWFGAENLFTVLFGQENFK